MSGPAKREMTIVGAKKIETVWIREAIWVSICSGKDGHDSRALANFPST